MRIRDIEIKNFRCFKSQRLTDLRRVNVIVGENGSGKTSLMEAIFLVGGNSPELTLRMRAQRGLGDTVLVNQDRKVTDEIWRDLFFDLDMSSPILITITDSEGPSRSVVVGRPGSGAATIVPLNGKPSLTVPIEFTWSVGDRPSTAGVKLTPEGLVLGLAAGADVLPISYFYSTVSAAAPSEAAARYSELSKQNREDDFLKSLKQLFPFVQRLSTETNAGVVMLYAKIYGLSPKIPLAVVSQGVNKLVQLLLGIEVARKGAVLVDELEDGIYFKHLPKVWACLLESARRADAQLFISTHSGECLAALRDVIRGKENDFALIRTERLADGGSALKQFSGVQLEAALNQEIEIR